MTVLIVIPARGGSKGIPLKNIYQINGKPLMQYTIEFAKNLPIDKEILVSTDHQEIATIATGLGVFCPFLRPTQISTDYVGDMAVLRHCLIEFGKLHQKNYELVVMLQPTSPIRFNHQILSAIEKIKAKSYDSVISVSKVPIGYHALKQFRLTDGRLIPFIMESKNIYARQQLEQSYIRNGIVYVFNSSFILKSDSVFSDNTGYIITDEEYINIDSLVDLEAFQKYLCEHGV